MVGEGSGVPVNVGGGVAVIVAVKVGVVVGVARTPRLVRRMAAYVIPAVSKTNPARRPSASGRESETWLPAPRIERARAGRRSDPQTTQRVTPEANRVPHVGHRRGPPADVSLEGSMELADLSGQDRRGIIPAACSTVLGRQRGYALASLAFKPQLRSDRPHRSDHPVHMNPQVHAQLHGGALDLPSVDGGGEAQVTPLLPD
jgi:hypothetical protein